MNAPLPLAQLQQQGGAVAQAQNFAPGFGSAHAFELMIRQSRLLMTTTLVPSAYRSEIVKLDKYGNVKESRENPNALSNCAVALNMATRMGADPLMVMQNLYIVEGRPSWSSQWIIAAINGCGRFSPLRFEIKVLGAKEVPYTTTFWENNERRTKTEMVKITDKQAIAWVKELATGERLESPPVTIEMAVKEGWYTKNGSKWQTMDEVMLRYRTASFFGKLYAPELLMGLQSTEEIHDFIDMEQPASQAAAPAVPVTELRQTREGGPAPMADEVDQRQQGAAAGAGSAAGQQVDQGTGEILGAGTATAGKPPFDPDAFALKLEQCTSIDTLDVMADEIRDLTSDPDLTEVLTGIYHRRRNELLNQATGGTQQQTAQPAAEQQRGTSRRAARGNTPAPSAE